MKIINNILIGTVLLSIIYLYWENYTFEYAPKYTELILIGSYTLFLMLFILNNAKRYERHTTNNK